MKLIWRAFPADRPKRFYLTYLGNNNTLWTKNYCLNFTIILTWRPAFTVEGINQSNVVSQKYFWSWSFLYLCCCWFKKIHFVQILARKHSWNTKTWKCIRCGKLFIQKRHLNWHKTTHVEVKTFAVEYGNVTLAENSLFRKYNYVGTSYKHLQTLW